MSPGICLRRILRSPSRHGLCLVTLVLLASLPGLAGCGETSSRSNAAPPAEDGTPRTQRAPETSSRTAPPSRPASPDEAGPVREPDPTPPGERISGPSIHFDTTRHDFGRIWDTEDHPCSFPFTNRGDAPLQIHRVTSSCTCTTAELDKWQYAPGESGFITTTFEPSKAGPQTQTITILSNDPTRPVMRLGVIADVRQFIDFDERFARFGQVERHHEHRNQITLRCAGTDMVIEGIESGNPHVSTEILETDAEAGRAVIEVTLHDNAPWGIIRNATLDCTVSGRLPNGQPARKTRTIRAVGTVVDEIRSDLYSMSVGLVPPGGSFSGSATVYHVNSEPFEIAEASIRDAKHAAIELSVAEDRQSFEGGYWLTIQGRADYDNDALIVGFIEFRATTRTDPTGSVRRIPIIGKIGVPQH